MSVDVVDGFAMHRFTLTLSPSFTGWERGACRTCSPRDFPSPPARQERGPGGEVTRSRSGLRKFSPVPQRGGEGNRLTPPLAKVGLRWGYGPTGRGLEGEGHQLAQRAS